MIVVTITKNAGVGPVDARTYTKFDPLAAQLVSWIFDDSVGTITITKSTPVDLDPEVPITT